MPKEIEQDAKIKGAPPSSFGFSVDPKLMKFADDGSSEADRKRTFSLIAYTGDAINDHWYWGQVVFDISTMSLAANSIPALLDHDRAQRVGYSTSVDFNQQTGFQVSGNLLTNAFAQEVSRDADDGFPWQVSVDIRPSEIDYIGEGVNTTVNGRDISGPAYIFRNSRIVEISFTATGWDAGTTATVMSNVKPTAPTEAPKPTEDTIMTPEEIEKMKTQYADQAKRLRRSEATQLFSSCGLSFDPESEEGKGVMAMEDAAFTTFSSVMVSTHKKFSAAKPPEVTQSSKVLPDSLTTEKANDGKDHFGDDGKGGNPKESPLVTAAKQFANEHKANGKQTGML